MELEKSEVGQDILQTVEKTHMRVVAVFLNIHQKMFSKAGCEEFLDWLFKDSSSKTKLGSSKFCHMIPKKEFSVDGCLAIKAAFHDSHPFVDKMLKTIFGFGIKQFLEINKGRILIDKPKSDIEATRKKDLADQLGPALENPPAHIRPKSSDIAAKQSKLTLSVSQFLQDQKHS